MLEGLEMPVPLSWLKYRRHEKAFELAGDRCCAGHVGCIVPLTVNSEGLRPRKRGGELPGGMDKKGGALRTPKDKGWHSDIAETDCWTSQGLDEVQIVPQRRQQLFEFGAARSAQDLSKQPAKRKIRQPRGQCSNRLRQMGLSRGEVIKVEITRELIKKGAWERAVNRYSGIIDGNPVRFDYPSRFKGDHAAGTVPEQVGCAGCLEDSRNVVNLSRDSFLRRRRAAQSSAISVDQMDGKAMR
ncbi:MAG: hypothetical protein ABIQ51_06705 [Mesorhizobium sp.]